MYGRLNYRPGAMMSSGFLLRLLSLAYVECRRNSPCLLVFLVCVLVASFVSAYFGVPGPIEARDAGVHKAMLRTSAPASTATTSSEQARVVAKLGVTSRS